MTARSKINAGDAAVEVLSRAGVRRFYTVPGESFLEVMDAVERHRDLSLVSTRHESGAAFMAEADAKLTGVPAVAMATRGVGASNLASPYLCGATLPLHRGAFYAVALGVSV